MSQSNDFLQPDRSGRASGADQGSSESLIAALLVLTRLERAVSRDIAHEAGMNITDFTALQIVVHGADHGEETGAATLARALHLTPAAVTKVVDRLVALGHVVREAYPGDRRRSLLVPTPAGCSLIDAKNAEATETVRAHVRSYDEEELAVTSRVLTRLAMDLGQHVSTARTGRRTPSVPRTRPVPGARPGPRAGDGRPDGAAPPQGRSTLRSVL